MNVKRYTLGNWTKSTFEVLDYLKQQNENNIFPLSKDLPSGTYRNWISPLKKGEYIADETRLQLTDKGKDLLEQLKNKSPEERRGKRTPAQHSRINPRELSEENMYKITIQGKLHVHESLVSEKEAFNIINILLKKRKKKVK